MENNVQTLQTNWKTTDNRFVAFLDILGFKDLIMRSEHDDIYKTLNYISTLRNTIEQWGTQTGSSSEGLLYTASFSDSIVIFSKNDDFETFKSFCSNVAYLFAKAIERNVALKGAIAYGQISINKSNQIYFGQPIIDAYLLEGEVNYLGIICHNSIDKYLSINLPGTNKTLFASNTPLKTGDIFHTNISWFRHLELDDLDSRERRSEKIKEIIEALRLNVSGAPRKYIDNTLKVLAIITANFPNLLDN